jgi:hypothetical protein
MHYRLCGAFRMSNYFLVSAIDWGSGFYGPGLVEFAQQAIVCLEELRFRCWPLVAKIVHCGVQTYARCTRRRFRGNVCDSSDWQI